MKRYWELVADNLSKAGWSWGCIAAVGRDGRIIWVADAHRGDGKRFVVHADEKVTAVSGAGIGDQSPRRGLAAAPWSDDSCPKSLVEEIKCLRDQS